MNETMNRLIFLIFIIFLWNPAKAQDFEPDSALYVAILENDLGFFATKVSEIKETMSEDIHEDDIDPALAIDMLIMLTLPAVVDRPEMCQILIDSLRDMNNDVFPMDFMADNFAEQALEAGSPGVLKQFIGSLTFPLEKPFETVVDCEYAYNSEGDVTKGDLEYVRTLEVLIEAGYEMEPDNQLLDRYFSNSACKGRQFVEALVASGATGSQASRDRLAAMRQAEFQLISAIQTDDYATFQRALSDDINLEFLYQDTLLMEYAIYYDREDMMLDLIEAGADIEFVNPQSHDPAYFALSKDNSLEMFDALLPLVEDINRSSSRGTTLLFDLVRGYTSTDRWGYSRLKEKEKLHFLNIAGKMESSFADFNKSSAYYGDQSKPFRLIANQDLRDSVDMVIFGYFLDRTNGIGEYGKQLVTKVYNTKDSLLIHTVIRKLPSYDILLEVIEENPRVMTGMSYLMKEHAKKLTEPNLQKMIWIFGFLAPDANHLSYVVDSLPSKSLGLEGDQLATKKQQLLDHRYPQRFDDPATLLYAILYKDYFGHGRALEDEVYRPVVDFLIRSGATLTIGQGDRSALDGIISGFQGNSVFHESFYNGILGRLNFFDFNKQNEPVYDYQTGETFRRNNVYHYEQQTEAELRRDFCNKCSVGGPGGNRVSLSGLRLVQGDLLGPEIRHNGTFTYSPGPHSVCDEKQVDGYFAIGTGFDIRTIWSVTARKYITEGPVRYSATGSTSLQQKDMSCQFSYTISQCAVSESNVNCLPTIEIHNESGSTGSITLKQNGAEQNVSSGGKVLKDRTQGPITVSFTGSGKDVEIETLVTYNTTLVDLRAIRNRSGSALSDRLFTYLQAYRGQELNGNTRSAEAMNRLVSEYMLEKGYDRSAKEVLDELYQRLIATNEEVLKLYEFQRAYSQQQIGSIDQLIVLLVEARDTTNDPDLAVTIGRTLDRLEDDTQLILTQLEIFTSSYFNSLTQDIQRFERTLLEYSFFVDAEEIDRYKQDPKIRIVL